jgi:hypothetical protein
MNPNHDRVGRPANICVSATLLVLLLCGCRTGVPLQVDGAYQPLPTGGIDFGPYNQSPKPRLGCLPYPGPATLFATADPNHLGRHAYDEQTGETETDRGIIYTCRGGFIDIAHARKTADLCKYTAVRVEMALMNDWSALQLKLLEPSVYIVHLEYPPFWKTLSPGDKKQLAHELSIRIAQRLAMLMMTWHELLTWFDYRSVVFVSERPSAFTWDDTGAHAFGVTVGGRALRDTNGDWDGAVTEALDSLLRQLSPVTPEQTVAAVNQIEGKWWSGSEPLKRDIDTGWDGQPIVPWLVPDLPFCKDATPYHYELPGLGNVLGRDCRSLLHIDIYPNVMETGKIRDTIPGKPSVIDVDKHLPIILEHIRQWHIRREGEQALRP